MLETNASPSRRQPSAYALAWGFYLVVAIVGLVWLGFQNDRLPLGLFLDPGSWLADAALGLTVGALLAAVWALGCRFWSRARALEARLAGLLGPLRADEAVALAVISGVAEEVLFRGAVLQAWGWVAATLLFALVHFGGRAFHLWAFWALAAGLLLALLVVWRGNLLPAVLTHAVVNTAGLLRLRRLLLEPSAKCRARI